MSNLVDRWEYDDGSYELGDKVWFKLPYGGWARGKVARVYSTRFDYHVEYDGDRYSVNIHEMSRERPEDE